MLTVAYFANQFPAAVEPYVSEEIEELQRRGMNVIAGSACLPDLKQRLVSNALSEANTLYLPPIPILPLLKAFWLAVRRWKKIVGPVTRVLLRGKESPARRLKTLLHTWLGAYYAVLLQERGVDHIHVHHGYFASWIAMVAARLLGASLSVTLHGSDLLLHGAYLDTKLKHCSFCVTISEYNRRYILDRFPEIDAEKIIVSRLGVNTLRHPEPPQEVATAGASRFTFLAVGRLHTVKDHAFLVRACARLRDCGLNFGCVIAGEGPERSRLELLIRENRLQDRVVLPGHIARDQIDSLYRSANLIVLTSRSEGIPLVLMEAMARSKIVLAPAITGIPELVIPGKTGFLYAPGHLEDFVRSILFLWTLMREEEHPALNRLDWIRHAARVQVLNNFSRQKNLTYFGDLFLQRIDRSPTREDLVLQQI